MSIAVTPLQAPLGAEIGIDLREPVSEEGYAAIVDAINAHAVLVFRHDGPLTDEQQIAFGRGLGPLQQLTMIRMLAGDRARPKYPELIDVSNLDEDGNIRAADDRGRKYGDGNLLWHTDTSFDEVRGLYSVLSARVIPPVNGDGGGDTLFADMRAAYDALDDAMKARLEGLVAEHSVWHSRALGGLTEITEKERASRPPSRHLLVHVHPVSGRKCLYLASHISHIVGIPEDESAAILAELRDHATQPEFVYRHKWRDGDVIMWDNLATMHRATEFDSYTHVRDMRRVTVLEHEMTV